MELQLFRRFINTDELNEISAILHEQSIEHLIKSPSSSIGSSFGSNDYQFHELYIHESDFDRVNTLLKYRAAALLKKVEPDHPLFAYSNDELRHILATKDEWSELDVKLSAKILRNRGKSDKVEKFDPLSLDQYQNEETTEDYPHFDHKKHFIISYLRFLTFFFGYYHDCPLTWTSQVPYSTIGNK